MSRKTMRLGDMLVKAGKIDEFQLNSALSYQRHWGGQIGTSLIKLGYIGEEDLLQFLAEQLNLTRIDLSCLTVAPELLALLPVEKALEYTVIPVDRKELSGTVYLLVAMSNPTNLIVIDALQFATGCRVRPALATEEAIRTAIKRCYQKRPVAVKTLDDPPVNPPLPDIDPFRFSGNQPGGGQSLEERFDRLLALLVKKGLLSASEVKELK
ncbi:hypothetical protein [Trichloromonas sp.]|uniref:GspE/PulE/PilB domain-containing protein n=1 Tax=Trichloromonas sp. TaxID=3069249 RepID=UPI002A3DE0B5|nr:hypothetical protein [Trichloromonas sp.]